MTQLVRLIKRVCGLWVRAQTHQETGRPKTSLCYRNILGSNKKKRKILTARIINECLFIALAVTIRMGKEKSHSYSKCIAAVNVIYVTAV